MARLEISKVITGDKGEYRAIARNKHGEGVATINLNFEGNGKPKYAIRTFFLSQFCFKSIRVVNRDYFLFSLFDMFLLAKFPQCKKNSRWKIATFPQKANYSPRRRHSDNGMHFRSASSTRCNMVSR